MNGTRTFPPAVVRDAELAEAFAAGLVARVVEAAREWRAALFDLGGKVPGADWRYANANAALLAALADLD